MVRWRRDDVAALCEAWRNGEDIGVLCDRFGRSENAIRQQLHFYGVYRSAEKLSEVRRKAGAGRAK